MSELEIAVLLNSVTMAMLVGGVLVTVFKGKVSEADQKLDEGIQKQIDNREQMQFWETRWNHLSSMQQQILNATIEFGKIVAPITPIRSDDTLIKWLDDIRTPPVPAPAPTEESNSNDEVVKG